MLVYTVPTFGLGLSRLVGPSDPAIVGATSGDPKGVVGRALERASSSQPELDPSTSTAGMSGSPGVMQCKDRGPWLTNCTTLCQPHVGGVLLEELERTCVVDPIGLSGDSCFLFRRYSNLFKVYLYLFFFSKRHQLSVI